MKFEDVLAFHLHDHTAKPGMTAAPVRAAIFAKAVLAQAGVPKKSTKDALLRATCSDRLEPRLLRFDAELAGRLARRPI